MKRLLLAMSLLALLTTAAFAQSQSGESGAQKFLARLTQSLNLTSTQQQQAAPMVNALTAQTTQQRQALRAELKQVLTPDQLRNLMQLVQQQRQSGQQADVVDMLNKVNLTDAQIDTLQPFLDQQTKERKEAWTAFFSKLKQILTPQQQQRLGQVIQQMQKKSNGQ